MNSVNYSKSYEREAAQGWWILKLRPSDLMQNTGSHHSTPLWSSTAGPEKEAEMFEFFNNNKNVLRNSISSQVWSKTAIPFASFHNTIIQEKRRGETENKPQYSENHLGWKRPLTMTFDILKLQSESAKMVEQVPA